MPVGKIGAVRLKMKGRSIPVKIDRADIQQGNPYPIQIIAAARGVSGTAPLLVTIARLRPEMHISEPEIHSNTMPMIQIVIAIYLSVRIGIRPPIINGRIRKKQMGSVPDIVIDIYILCVGGSNALEIVKANAGLQFIPPIVIEHRRIMQTIFEPAH